MTEKKNIYIYIQLCTQCALPVGTIMALWLHIVGLHCGVTRALKLRAVSKANMPIVNTSHEALHPIQRALKLYEQ